MKKVSDPYSTVSADELALLSGSAKKSQATGVDTWFKYRHAYILLVGILATGRAIFYPEVVARQLHLLSSVGDVSGYVQMRGLLSATLFILYWISYVKDWHSSKISLVMAAFSFVWLVADSFSFGRFGAGPMQPVMVATFLLRAGIVYCFFINSVRDNRAPAMPRHLFS
jgi:hypothetical protein